MVLDILGDAGSEEDLKKLLVLCGFEQYGGQDSSFWVRDHPVHGRLQAQVAEVPEKRSLAFLPSLYGNGELVVPA